MFETDKTDLWSQLLYGWNYCALVCTQKGVTFQKGIWCPKASRSSEQNEHWAQNIKSGL